MSYAGKWIFHSMISHNDDNEIVYLNAEEYLKAPMPYVDESDEEAVADEMKERNKMINMQIWLIGTLRHPRHSHPGPGQPGLQRNAHCQLRHCGRH